MMKKDTAEKFNTVGEIKNELWGGLSFLRGSITASDYHVALFLLTLYKEGHLNNIRHSQEESLKNEIGNAIRKLKKTDHIDYYLMYSVYEPILDELDNSTIQLLVNLFDFINTEVLIKNFPEIFDNLMYRISQFQGKFGGVFFQPAEITQFIAGLTELPEKSSVYNPFAGLSSFAVMLPQSSNYYGQEINDSAWALGMLRLLAYGRIKHTIFTNENSFENWGFVPKLGLNAADTKLMRERFKFDMVLASPQFGLRLQNINEGKFGTIRTLEHFLIEKGVEVLNSKGKLIAVIPQGFLFRSGSERNLRQHLLENDLIDTIISLPGGLLMQSGIPIVIFVINKEKQTKGVVRFVDGKNCINQSGRVKILKVEELNKLVYGKKDSDAVKIVTNQFIIENDCNLNVQRYFQANFEGVQLNQVIKVLRGNRNNGGVTGKIIRITELRDDKFNYTLNVDAIGDIEITYPNQLITESCLLISSIGEKLKATYFNYTEVPIHINPNIFAFKIDTQKIDLDYLVCELNSDATNTQIKSLVFGSVMPRLRKDDFLSIKIELPSLPEQKAKVKGLKEAHIKGREKELILEKEFLGLKDETFRQFASVKHTFRQYLNSLKSNVSGTRRFLENNAEKNITIKSVYSKNLNTTLGDHLLGLEGTIDSMAKLLTAFDDKAVSYPAEVINLEKLVEEAQMRHANLEIFQFEKLEIDEESFRQFDEELFAIEVKIAPEDFYQIFSNIVANAIEHGFRGSKKNNMIRTRLSFDSENLYCILNISNNGKPLSNGFTLKHLTTRGEKTSDSTGTGIGGSDIYEILDKYQGTLDIKSNPEQEFPVTYEIGLQMHIYEL